MCAQFRNFILVLFLVFLQYKTVLFLNQIPPSPSHDNIMQFPKSVSLPKWHLEVYTIKITPH